MIKTAALTTIFIAILYPLTFYKNVMETSSGGTILTFYNERGKAFAAADSRFYNPIFPNVRDDTGCKIISLSNNVFFFYSGGIAEVRNARNEILTSANILAVQSFKETSRLNDPYFRLRETARHWGDLMKPIANQILRITPKDQRPSEVQLGGFGGLDSNGTPKMILVSMGVTVFDDNRPSISTYEISEWPSAPNLLQGFGGVITAIEDANEFLNGATLRAKQANILFNQTFGGKPINDRDSYLWTAAIESAVRWGGKNPFIGGKVDAVVLENGKDLRWIQRKQSCYQEDSTH